MDFLKELYLGNICPADRNVYRNPEYKKAEREFMNCYEVLIKDMPQEKLEQLEKVLETNQQTFSIKEEDTFKIGFSLGVHIINACSSVDLQSIEQK